MFRQYEDPYWLEKKLEEAEIEMQQAIDAGDEDMQIALAEEIADLRERVNFAWQDDEWD